jgi:hypothetical protein
MNVELLDALQAVTRRARKAKRTSGRIVLSALGFGVAYYFDTTNGAARRQKLQEQLRTAVRKIDGVFSPDPVVGDVPPVFGPLLQSGPKRSTIRPQSHSKTG